MDVTIYQDDGVESGETAELDPTVFDIEPNDHVQPNDVIVRLNVEDGRVEFGRLAGLNPVVLVDRNVHDSVASTVCSRSMRSERPPFSVALTGLLVQLHVAVLRPRYGAFDQNGVLILQNANDAEVLNRRALPAGPPGHLHAFEHA